MCRLSIIIVNFNAREMLRDLLISLNHFLQPALEYEIICVDNASQDGSVEMVQRVFPNVLLIASKENLGFSRGNNLGISHSRGDTILLLNPDCLLTEDHEFSTILQKFSDDRRIGIIGGRVFDGNGRQASTFGHFPMPFTLWVHYSLIGKVMARVVPALRRYRLLNYDPSALQKEAIVDHVNGCCMFVRKSMLDEIGLLDESFFLYLEETDICLRAHQADWKVIYTPAKTVVHFGQASARPLKEKVSKIFLNSLRIFYKKHYPQKIPKLEMLLKFNVIKPRI